MSLFSPPICFLIVLTAAYILSIILSTFAVKPIKKPLDIGKSYACGEDVATHLMQPDYSQFFPFAFFFTMLHVAALIISTIPIATVGSFSIAIIYIIGAMVGLAILFRK